MLKIENELLECYVDDTTDALASIDAGVRFENNKLVKKEELVEEDMSIPEDERTMRILAEVANTVYKCVQFTVDYPSRNDENGKETTFCLLNGNRTRATNNNGEGMVPVLDLKVAVRENQIVHEYYEKPCAAKMVIPYTSAHSRRMKMAVLVE